MIIILVSNFMYINFFAEEEGKESWSWWEISY